MSSMQERLAIRMENAMKTMMESMAKMHREFEERMREERRVMQGELETMVYAQLGITQPITAVKIPCEEEPATNKETAAAPVLSDTEPTPRTIMTTRVAHTLVTKIPTENPPNVTATPLKASLGAKTSAQADVNKTPTNRIETRSPAISSQGRDSRLYREANINHGGKHTDCEAKTAKVEYAQLPSNSRITSMSSYIATHDQNTRLIAQDMANKLQALVEPRTEALKREDALEILRTKQMVNLPEAHLEKAVRYQGAIARLDQSVERMRLLTSGFGCSPRWALSKRKKYMHPFIHECFQALPMVC